MTGAIPAVVLGVAYLAGVRAAGRRWPVARTGAALAAVAVLALALGPLDAEADDRLAAHMFQHVAVGLLAPALLALAAPVRLVLAAAPPPSRRRLGRLLHRPPLRVLLRPPAAVALAAATLALLHLPGVMDAVERHGALHALDHAALFWTGLVAWIALLGVDPVPGSPGPVGLLVAGAAWMAPMALVGALYANADHLLVGAYAQAGATLGDQRDAGTLMLLLGPALLSPILLAAFVRALWREEERQRRRERLEELW